MPHNKSLAVDSGVWPLYRFDPRRLVKGEPPLNLDYGPPKAKVAEYMRNESRFRMIERSNPARYKYFLENRKLRQNNVTQFTNRLAGITVPVIEIKDDVAIAASRRRKKNESQHNLFRNAIATSAGCRCRTAGR